MVYMGLPHSIAIVDSHKVVLPKVRRSLDLSPKHWVTGNRILQKAANYYSTIYPLIKVLQIVL